MARKYYYSRRKLGKLASFFAVGGLLMAGAPLTAILGFWNLPVKQDDIMPVLIILTFGVIMLASTIWFLRKLRDGRPVISLGADRLFYREASEQIIPWPEIRAVDLDDQRRGGDLIVVLITLIMTYDNIKIRVADFGRYSPRQGIFGRAARAFYRFFNLHDMKISMLLIDAETRDLDKAIRECWAQYGNAAGSAAPKI